MRTLNNSQRCIYDVDGVWARFMVLAVEKDLRGFDIFRLVNGSRKKCVGKKGNERVSWPYLIFQWRSGAFKAERVQPMHVSHAWTSEGPLNIRSIHVYIDKSHLFSVGAWAACSLSVVGDVGECLRLKRASTCPVHYCLLFLRDSSLKK